MLTQTTHAHYEQLCRLDVLGLEDSAENDQQDVYTEFKEQLERSSEGWYQTALPWKGNHPPPLPNNCAGSLKRLDDSSIGNGGTSAFFLKMRLAIPGTTLNPTNRPTNSPQMKPTFFTFQRIFSKQLPNSHPYDYRHPYNHQKVHQNDPPNDSTFCILKLYIFPIESAFKYSHHSVTFSENRMSFSESQEVDDVIPQGLSR